MTQIILTSGTSWTVPADWNNADNTVECIGAGAAGTVSGGGGGAYAKISNLSLSGTVSYQIGVASPAASVAATWFVAATTVKAAGAVSPSGGATADSVGDVTYAGGAAAASNSSGGGGAAGPNGAGGSTTTGNSAGAAGDAGFGGVGSPYNSSALGGAGTEWGAAGSGGGGGGGHGISPGGLYGGGGGGGGGSGGGGGGGGVIVITYTPVVSNNSAQGTSALSAIATTAAITLTAAVVGLSGLGGFSSQGTLGEPPNTAVGASFVGRLTCSGTLSPSPTNAVVGTPKLGYLSSFAALGFSANLTGASSIGALSTTATATTTAPGAPLYYDRIQERSLSTGTGPFALDGATLPSMLEFSSKFTNGSYASYVALNLDVKTEWERGIGIYNAGLITRTHVTAGSNGALPVAFSAGVKNILSVAPMPSSGAAFDSTKVYTPGDTVTVSGSTWYSLTVNSGSAPAVGNANWTAVGGSGGGGSQVNSDWNATTGVAAILNKPTLGTAAALNVPASGNASSTQVVLGSDSRLGASGGAVWGTITGTLANQTDLQNALNAAGGGLVGVVSVTSYGASPGASAATNTTAFNQAIQAGLAQNAIVWVPGGTYTVNTIVVYSHTKLVGAGTQQTSLILANGVNSDVIQGYQARSLFGTNSSGGVVSVTIQGLLIDGNRAHNTAGCGIAIYGWSTVLSTIWVQNAAEHGVWSEAGSTSTVGATLLPHWDHVCAFHCGKHGIYYGGQHDGVMIDCECIGNSLLATNTYDNFHFYGNGSCRLIACHPWSDTLASNQAVRYACYIGRGAVSIIGGDYEGGWSANLYIDAGQSGFTQVSGMARFYANATNASVVINSPTIFDGTILAPYGSAVSTGIKLNDAAGKFCSDSIITAVMYGQATGVDFTYAGPANRVVVRGYFPDTSNATLGTASSNSSVDIVIGRNAGTQIVYHTPS